MAKYIVEGLWDCVYCGTKGIKGSVKICPTCGRPVGENVKYYLKDSSRANEVVPKSEDDTMPEWQCNYCGAYNKYTRTKCYRCGAAKETGTKDYFGTEERRELDYEGKVAEPEPSYEPDEPEDADEKPERAEYHRDGDDYRKYESSRRQYTSYTQPTPAPSYGGGYGGGGRPPIDWGPIFKWGGIALAVIALISTLLWLFVPHKSSVDIVDKEWARRISIEHYITVNEDDWSIPTGGRLRYTQQEIHHYDSVLDHYETVTEQKSRTVITGYRTETSTRDLGNGNFEVETREVPEYGTEYYTETHQEPVYKQVPVYQTKYYYEIERWKPARTVDTKGGTDEPYWGDVTLASNERESGRRGTYTLHYSWKETSKKINVNQESWEVVNIGDTVDAMVNKIGVTEIILGGTEVEVQNADVESDIVESTD